MAVVTLITATPWNATTAAAITVRMAGGGSKPYTGLGGFADWMAGVVEHPRFTASLEFDQNGPTGGAVAQFAAMSFYATTEANRDRLAGYEWIGCSIKIETCDDAVATPTLSLVLQGTVSAFECANDKMGITLTDLSVDLARPVLVDTFAGTGGIEGDAGVLGRYKRLTFGRAFNVEGRILNLANNIWEFGDPSKPLQSFDVVRDKGRAGTPFTTVAWAGSIAATYASLVAATPAGGGYAAAPSIACVKWWTQPSGPLTADIKGIVGPGYVETAPEVAAALLVMRSTSTITNTASMKAVRPDAAGVHCGDESETIANVLDRVLLGVSLGWIVNADGTVRLAPFTWSGSAETLVASSVARRSMFKPVGKRRLGYSRNYRVHTAGEISASVLNGEVDFNDVTGATKPANNADVTSQNTANNTSNVGAISAGSVSTTIKSGGGVEAGKVDTNALQNSTVIPDKVAYGTTGECSLSYDVNGVTFSSSAWVTVGNLPLTPLQGQPIHGVFTCVLTNVNGTSTQAACRIIRDDGTPVWGGGSGLTVAARDEGESLTATFFDSVGAGRATTYTVQMRKASGTNTVRADFRSFVVREMTREHFQTISLSAAANEGPGRGGAGGGNINGAGYGLSFYY